MQEIEYVWSHWKFNAEQRIKAFNFFVVFSVFANGGLFTVLEKSAHPSLMVIAGALIVLATITFYLLDIRSRRLLHLSIPAIRRYEETLSEEARLFALDAPNTKRVARYTVAFRIFFLAQALIGLQAFHYGIVMSSLEPEEPSPFPPLFSPASEPR